MIWIYADSITERLKYTLDFIFRERKIPYLLSSDKSLFLAQSHVIRLAYTPEKIEGILNVQPAELLFDNTIQSYKIDKKDWNSIDCIEFNEVTDPIASIFYVLSRYEEYLPFEADEHGRFTAKQSILSEFDWLDKPICDMWSLAIIQLLEKSYNTIIHIDKGEFSFLPTFDIDNSYAYKHKSGIQLWGAKIKDIFTSNSARIEERERVLSDIEKDPFDTFDAILALTEKRLNPRLFWHLGDLKKYDRNLSWTNEAHQRLIQRMGNQLEIGIHPSYFSNTNPQKVEEERGRLEYILARPIYASRQHFLKVAFPSTYTYLDNIGMKHEYSMGFSDAEGFRMGTARSFPFFNLAENCITQLMLHPFVYMDGTLNQYKGYSPEKAKEVIEELMSQVELYGGEFIAIWHNETIGESGIWKDWRTVFDYTIELGLNYLAKQDGIQNDV